MLKVWTDGAEAGLLDRHSSRGSSFSYFPATPAARSVSLTMPVRLPSWTVEFGLPPIFEMNLPEGFLRERLRLAFAKATGVFEELRQTLDRVGQAILETRADLAGYIRERPQFAEIGNRMLEHWEMRMNTCLRG